MVSLPLHSNILIDCLSRPLSPSLYSLLVLTPSLSVRLTVKFSVGKPFSKYVERHETINKLLSRRIILLLNLWLPGRKPPEKVWLWKPPHTRGTFFFDLTRFNWVLQMTQSGWKGNNCFQKDGIAKFKGYVLIFVKTFTSESLKEPSWRIFLK